MFSNKKIIDLSHYLSLDISNWNEENCFEKEVIFDYKDCKGFTKFRDEKCCMKMSAGTHIDAPRHCFEFGLSVDQIKVENLNVACVVIEIDGALGEPEKIVTVNHIINFEKQYGEIKEDCFVVFFTGWSFHWDDSKYYRNDLQFPSISKDVAQLLIRRNVVGIGIDTLSPDLPKSNFPVHWIMLKNNKYIIENISSNIVYMPPVGGFICISPLNVKDASESPVRIFGYF
jgi:kynurenine formamidase